MHLHLFSRAIHASGSFSYFLCFFLEAQEELTRADLYLLQIIIPERWTKTFVKFQMSRKKNQKNPKKPHRNKRGGHEKTSLWDKVKIADAHRKQNCPRHDVAVLRCCSPFWVGSAERIVHHSQRLTVFRHQRAQEQPNLSGKKQQRKNHNLSTTGLALVVSFCGQLWGSVPVCFACHYFFADLKTGRKTSKDLKLNMFTHVHTKWEREYQ